jgi:hypothetical protein
MGILDFFKKGVRVEKKKRGADDDDMHAIVPVAPIGLQPYSPKVEPTTETAPQFPTFHGQALSRSILIIVPNTNADVTSIVENLQNGEACVINLETMPIHEAQRRLDFLSGVVCAMNGAIKPIDQHKFILTPQGLGVRI